MPELGTESTYNPTHVCPYLQKMVGFHGVNPPSQRFDFGTDDYGCDVYFYGATSGAFLRWDETNDRLEVDGGQSELIRFVADGDGGVTVTNDGMNANPQTDTEDAFITVVVNATSYEIPLYAAA